MFNVKFNFLYVFQRLTRWSSQNVNIYITNCEWIIKNAKCFKGGGETRHKSKTKYTVAFLQHTRKCHFFAL